jgi:acyl carrier protein
LPRWDLTAKSKVFLSDEVRSELASHDSYREARETLPAEFNRWNSMAQAQFLEAAILLPGYILSSQGDRMAMAHSVEGRFPFLDHRVIEFADSLPPRLKMKTLNEKYVLKRAAGHLVPESIKSRPKQPYRAPDARSFFDGESEGAERLRRRAASTECVRGAGLFNAWRRPEARRQGAQGTSRRRKGQHGSGRNSVRAAPGGSVHITRKVRLMQAVEQQIRAFIVDNFLFGEESRAVAGTDSFLDLGIIDSTGVLELVTFLEISFAFKVEDAELIPDNLDSVDGLVAFIQRKTRSSN